MKYKQASKPVSRVLSWTAICLGPLLPAASGGSVKAKRAAFYMPFSNLASDGVYRAFAVAGKAVGSCPTFPPLPQMRRFISVALSLESPPPVVSRRPAL